MATEPLSPTARKALAYLNERGEMPVGWKNTPYIMASGTAEALRRRGFARRSGMLHSGTFLVTITDEGRAQARGVADGN